MSGLDYVAIFELLSITSNRIVWITFYAHHDVERCTSAAVATCRHRIAQWGLTTARSAGGAIATPTVTVRMAATSTTTTMVAGLVVATTVAMAVDHQVQKQSCDGERVIIIINEYNQILVSNAKVPTIPNRCQTPMCRLHPHKIVFYTDCRNTKTNVTIHPDVLYWFETRLVQLSCPRKPPHLTAPRPNTGH